MISVCIATYNGAKYIKQQLESILSQIGDKDEVIISDDLSKDNTLEIVRSFRDKRIKIFSNQKNHGPVSNFENALSLCSGDIIFLSDQDDIWLNGRVEESLKVLNLDGCECVICNRNLIDKNGKITNIEVVKDDFTKYSFFRVLIHNPYIGCCMAFTRKHLNQCLPFPSNIAMHDIWIGLLAHKLKIAKFLPTPYVLYRRHGENVTGRPFPIVQRINYRIKFIKELSKRIEERKLLKYSK